MRFYNNHHRTKFFDSFLFLLDGLLNRTVWCWLVYGVPVQGVHSRIHYVVLGGGYWFPNGVGAGLGV